MSNKVNNDIIFNVIDWADKDDIDETEDDAGTEEDNPALGSSACDLDASDC